MTETDDIMEVLPPLEQNRGIRDPSGSEEISDQAPFAASAGRGSQGTRPRGRSARLDKEECTIIHTKPVRVDRHDLSLLYAGQRSFRLYYCGKTRLAGQGCKMTRRTPTSKTAAARRSVIRDRSGDATAAINTAPFGT